MILNILESLDGKKEKLDQSAQIRFHKSNIHVSGTIEQSQYQLRLIRIYKENNVQSIV